MIPSKWSVEKYRPLAIDGAVRRKDLWNRESLKIGQKRVQKRGQRKEVELRKIHPKEKTGLRKRLSKKEILIKVGLMLVV